MRWRWDEEEEEKQHTINREHSAHQNTCDQGRAAQTFKIRLLNIKHVRQPQRPKPKGKGRPKGMGRKEKRQMQTQTRSEIGKIANWNLALAFALAKVLPGKSRLFIGYCSHLHPETRSIKNLSALPSSPSYSSKCKSP